ncbi:serine/arginine repetitive matrix protein 5-like [Carassius gibelio]|uniref:serine/arginine repetitive matrix protein 5-like n=1 Tax=Carassius gibelio TaxID=101364 RepID=UPI0022779BA7|nr:serine/arginine repetitive matrix protein 5-like [Carassius gibelio]
MGGKKGGSGLDGTSGSGAEGLAGLGGGGRGMLGGNTGDTETSELGGTSGDRKFRAGWNKWRHRKFRAGRNQRRHRRLRGGRNQRRHRRFRAGRNQRRHRKLRAGRNQRRNRKFQAGRNQRRNRKLRAGRNQRRNRKFIAGRNQRKWSRGNDWRLRGYTGESGLDGTSGETGKLGITSIDQSIRSISCSILPETGYSSPSVAEVWAGLSSMPSISTKTPMTHGVAGSPTWSVTLSMSCLLSVNGSGSAAVVGSGSVRPDGGWLVSGSRVELARSSMGQTVRGDPFLARVHSTNAANSSRGPSSGENALHLEFRLVL